MASVISRATGIGLTWDALEALTDDALEQRLYGPKIPGRVARPRPDPAWIHTELRRAGVTLELLHLEYLQQHPDGYRYSAFCAHYRDWLGRQRVSMRQVHQAGEKLFVDYSGKKPEVVEAATGVVRAGRIVCRRPGRLELHVCRGDRSSTSSGSILKCPNCTRT